MTFLTLTATRALQLRATTPDTDTGPLTLTGMVVPWGEEFTRLGGVRFTFERGSLRLPDDLATVALLQQHDDDRPIGYALTAQADDTGLHMTFALPDHPRTAAAVTELELGLRTGLSVGVEIDDQVLDQAFDVWLADGQQTDPIEMAGLLREVSQVTIPQFNNARIEHRPQVLVTAAHPAPQEDPPMTTLTAPAEVDVAAALAQLGGRVDAVEARTLDPVAPAEPRPALASVIGQALQDFAGRPRTTAALADVVGGGNGGLLPPQWSSELVGYLDARRNLFAAAGTVTFPTTGYGLTFPRLTQRTLVGPRGAEKTQVPSRALTTDTVSYPIEWFAGAVDVALELIAQSDPGVLAVVWADMLDQYAIATETAFVAKSEAAAGTSAGALDFSDYGTFVKAVVQASVAIRTATGVPGDLLALTTPSWVELLSIVDGDTRRILATSGQTNGDGSALFTAEAVNVGGINCFHSPASTKDLQFNTKSLRKGEKPSMQLTSDNVALMGRDVGILGATIAVPLYPGGIVAHAPAARAR